MSGIEQASAVPKEIADQLDSGTLRVPGRRPNKPKTAHSDIIANGRRHMTVHKFQRASMVRTEFRWRCTANWTASTDQSAVTANPSNGQRTMKRERFMAEDSTCRGERHEHPTRGILQNEHKPLIGSP
jgi:hypothetical protein